MKFNLSYRVVQPRKKKKTMRLKIMGSYVNISRTMALAMVLGSVVGFFALAGFLYYLWYIHIPCVTGPNPVGCP